MTVQCQAAIEAVATEQLESLRNFGRSLREEDSSTDRAAAPARAERAGRTPGEDRLVRKLYEQVAAEVAAVTPAHAQEIRRALGSRLLAEG